ncbi:hypothetical protein AFL01nite_19770 [Aeromicrobium flavum]|uniref:Uncharacterized protein n=1 Tax=Aeromicrobium flavum TaxID=416568 RepID=A0A512HW58_9ACTN|nr:hypothetical protein [Aeromicrobium flavum]GEO89650.1 hypothetical protein AFL01nite_19770 [Aeromicrobium flavum]
MTTTLTDLMPANTTAPTTVPNEGLHHAEATTGEEVKTMSLFDFGIKPQQRADLDRLVVLERIKQRRRAQAHVRAVHSQLWGVRANR